MKNFRNRTAEKARRAASGGDGPPAGQDPAARSAPATADRRRLRAARSARDERLHELGALVMEMHRQGKHNAALVERKAQEAIAADAQVRALDGTGAPAAAPQPSPPPAAPPPDAGARVDAPPAAAPVAAAPPEAPARVDAPPPSASDRVDGSDGSDGVPTYSVTSP